MLNDKKRDIDVTRQALIDAAEKLMIGCNDVSEVTSRAITKEAGVNLAMINYCFGSREALLFEVFERVKHGAQCSNPEFARIFSSQLPPKELLIELHIESVKMMIENYKYAKAIIAYVLLNRGILAERGSLQFIVQHFQGRKSEEECRLIAYQISSLRELMILRYEDLRDSCGVDLTDEQTLRRIVTDNICRFLD